MDMILGPLKAMNITKFSKSKENYMDDIYDKYFDKFLSSSIFSNVQNVSNFINCWNKKFPIFNFDSFQKFRTLERTNIRNLIVVL